MSEINARIKLKEPGELKLDDFESLRYDMVALSQEILFLAGIQKQQIFGTEFDDVEETGVWDDLPVPTKTKIKSVIVRMT